MLLSPVSTIHVTDLSVCEPCLLTRTSGSVSTFHFRSLSLSECVDPKRAHQDLQSVLLLLLLCVGARYAALACHSSHSSPLRERVSARPLSSAGARETYYQLGPAPHFQLDTSNRSSSSERQQEQQEQLNKGAAS